jgi:hypothetical protein
MFLNPVELGKPLKTSLKNKKMFYNLNSKSIKYFYYF